METDYDRIEKVMHYIEDWTTTLNEVNRVLKHTGEFIISIHHPVMDWKWIDDASGDYTRLTRFKPGADTSVFGTKSHEYPEEIFARDYPEQMEVPWRPFP